MKQTTKKILLWLYETAEVEDRQVAVDDLRLILPEITNSGFRSLLNLLKKQQLISQEEKEDKNQLRLTSYGRGSLEAEFPVFSPVMNDWSGQWSLVLFSNAPKSDKQFRYLRKFLVDRQCGQLARGVYVYPGVLPSDVKTLLLKLYIGSVTVVSIDQWLFGDEQSIISGIYSLSDLKNSYSGISTEIHQLLKQKSTKKSIEDRDKQAVCLVFDRLVNSLHSDLGLLPHYYPDSKSGDQLLSQLQTLY
jgi:DNA-binding transcriptional regulator PaaX